MARSGPTHHTLSVLVENTPGVLTRVSSLFARRSFNIESLAGEFVRTGSELVEETMSLDHTAVEQLIDASKVSESEAHVEAENHGTVVARELIGHAA